MVPPNQPLQVPRNKSLAGKLLQRSPFTNGKVKTYMTGGQSPYTQVVGDPGYAYAPPTNWPASGLLLRVPQQVYFSFTRYATTAGVTVDGNVQQIFIQAARQINFLRGSKTSAMTIAPGQFYAKNFWTHLIGPDPTDPPFFGGKVLHFYVFVPQFQGTVEIPLDWYRISVAGLLEPTYTGANTGVGGSYYQIAKNRVAQNDPAFAGYRCYMYGIQPSPVWDPQTQIAINNAFSQQTAADMSAYGFTYEGDTLTISFQNIMAKTASYFHFDPSNGQDLPVGGG